MGIVLAYSKNKKAKVIAVGETLDLLTLLVAISRCLTDRILEEKEVSLEKAEYIVIDCIKDGMKTVKE